MSRSLPLIEWWLRLTVTLQQRTWDILLVVSLWYKQQEREDVSLTALVLYKCRVASGRRSSVLAYKQALLCWGPMWQRAVEGRLWISGDGPPTHRKNKAKTLPYAVTKE